MTLKEQIRQDLERLNMGELRAVADFMTSLGFRAGRQASPQCNEAKMTALYAAFAEEDRTLTEAGMSDFAAGLTKEDAA